MLFEPFERHVIENTGDTDLIFPTLYWRDAERAVRAAARTDRRRLGERPCSSSRRRRRPTATCTSATCPGPYLGADVFVRFQRMNGAEAWHLTGSDDFQSYVLAAAEREGSRRHRRRRTTAPRSRRRSR